MKSALEDTKLKNQLLINYYLYYDWLHPDVTKEEIKEKNRLAKIAAGTAPREGKAKKESRSSFLSFHFLQTCGSLHLIINTYSMNCEDMRNHLRQAVKRWRNSYGHGIEAIPSGCKYHNLFWGVYKHIIETVKPIRYRFHTVC